MTMAGPRVYYALGKDFSPFAYLARTPADRCAPRSPSIAQGIVTSLIILSGRVDQIQVQYAGLHDLALRQPRGVVRDRTASAPTRRGTALPGVGVSTEARSCSWPCRHG